MTDLLPLGHSAVMAMRAEARDSADHFPTPPWATRALIQRVLPQLGVLAPTLDTIWEPACGDGMMARVLAEYTDGMPVIASDLHDYGYGKTGVDFLNHDFCLGANWIITNPPFNIALEFTKRALDLASDGVAMLVRTQWLEGVRRYTELFNVTPPTLIAPFVERVPMVKGRWDPDVSTATSYAWFVWLQGYHGPTEVYWIPPGQRQALTHPDDRLRFCAPDETTPHDPDLITAARELET
jgi:hypothetical protein